MEDALREIRSNKFLIGEEIVLILVLMEDALRECRLPLIQQPHWVLILVLMEDALRDKTMINIKNSEEAS